MVENKRAFGLLRAGTWVFRNKVARLLVGFPAVMAGMALAVTVCDKNDGLPFEMHGRELFCFAYAVLLTGYLLICLPLVLASKKARYTIMQLDEMTGTEFERACADILRSNGFKQVSLTKASGDFGVDIIAEKQGVSFAVQCKCYSRRLDSKPVQEVAGGLGYYGCDQGIVMTNSDFTAHAVRLAEANEITLIDRPELEKMLKKM
ncbi:MAG: restriction endonuclease [Ruminococcus sp.]|nr:restriction endonuclease [Ruminococcus sp.]